MESEFSIVTRSVIQWQTVIFSTQLKCLRMMIGFCSIKRSVVCMLLMAVLSNARLRLIPNSSSFVSVDTDCPVERLESRLASIGDQLNRLLRIVSSLNTPLIKENCTVDLASYGYDDSTKYGYIRTNGGSAEEVYVKEQLARYRGVTIVELDATTCTTRKRQRFDTYANATDRIQLVETMESTATGTIIVGVTADSAEHGMNFQNSTGLFFSGYGMNLSGLQSREKFAFIMQKGYPKKTVFRKTPRYGESLRMKVELRGSTIYDVTFNRV